MAIKTNKSEVNTRAYKLQKWKRTGTSNADLSVQDASYDTFDSSYKSAGVDLSNGDLTLTRNSSNGSSRCTTGHSTGKYYWEVTIDTDGGDVQSGICDADDTVADGWVGGTTNTIGYYSNGAVYQNNGVLVSGLANFAATSVVSFALDLDNGFFYVGHNGSWQNSGDPTSGASGTGAVASSLSGGWMPSSGCWAASDAVTANYGASAFSYSVPAGYVSGWTQ